MKLDLKLLTVALAALVVGEAYFVGRDVEHSKTLLAQITDSYETSLKLEKEIGYGGLIHNFKNYVLRSDEVGYRDKASANAARALELVNILETHGNSLGVGIDLTHTRDTIMAYQRNIDLAQSMFSEGAAAEAVDESVRINDEMALLEITSAAAMITKTAREKLDRLRVVSELRLVLVLFLFSGGLIYTFLSLRKAQQLTEEIESANTELASTNESLTLANTELAHSNTELERRNTSLRQFAGIAAHDLRSPVRQIALMADMMPKDGEDPAKIVYFTDEIRNAALRLDQSVASLLDFSKTGFQNPRSQRVDPYVLIEDLLRDLAAPIDGLNASIERSNLPKVDADPELLKRVFQNLIENSLRFSDEQRKPEISIFATGAAHAPIFCVADNGIGIDPAHAERIFLPMQRLHDRRDKYEGIGIGLSLVKAIVESHGGAVWLDTEYRSGAKICFSLNAQGGSSS